MAEKDALKALKKEQKLKKKQKIKEAKKAKKLNEKSLLVSDERCSFSEDFSRHCSRFEGDPTEMHFLFAANPEGNSFQVYANFDHFFTF